jgi:hypothetical protein
MKGRMLRIGLVALPAFAILTGLAWAADVNINVGAPDQSAPVVVQPSQPSVIGQPSQAPSVAGQPPPATVIPTQPGSAVIVAPGPA